MRVGLLLACMAIAGSPLFAGEKYADLKDKSPVVNQFNAGDLDSTGWCRARSKFGGYAVDLPGKYVDTMLKISNPRGGFLVMHNLMTKPSAGGTISVAFMERHGQYMLPGDPFDELVKRNREQGRLTKQEVIKVSGQDADHLAMSDGKQLADM